IDENGLPDLVLSHTNGGAAWVQGKGDLTFERTRQVPLRGNVAVADLDADGHLELIGPDATFNAMSICTHNGNGDFTIEKRLAVTSKPYSAAVSDTDGDGDLDMAAG